MGYRVKLLGTDFISNSTVYRAYRPDPGAVDQSYLVRVSYLSDGGVTARNVSEVVWHWLRAPGSRWTMVQRIVPDHPAVDSASTDLWESAMRRAFNLS